MLGEMIVLFVVAILAVLSLIVMMARIGLKKFLGYPNLVDIFCTLVFVTLFHGTFSGMCIAAFSGLIMSLILWALRGSVGAERLRVVRRGVSFGYEWYTVPASDLRPHWLGKIFSPVNAK